MATKLPAKSSPSNSTLRIAEDFEIYIDQERIPSLNIYNGWHKHREVWVRKEPRDVKTESEHEATIVALTSIDRSDSIAKIFCTVDKDNFRYTAIERGDTTFAQAASSGIYPKKRQTMIKKMLRIYKLCHTQDIMLRTQNLDSFCVYLSEDRKFRVKLINLHCAKIAPNNTGLTEISRTHCQIKGNSYRGVKTMTFDEDMKFGFVDMAMQLLANRKMNRMLPIVPTDFQDKSQADAWSDLLNVIYNSRPVPTFSKLLGHWSLMKDHKRLGYIERLCEEKKLANDYYKNIQQIDGKKTILGKRFNWKKKMPSSILQFFPHSAPKHLTSYGDGSSVERLTVGLRNYLVHVDDNLIAQLEKSKSQDFWKHDYPADKFLWMRFVEEIFSPLPLNLWKLTAKDPKFVSYHTEIAETFDD